MMKWLAAVLTVYLCSQAALDASLSETKPNSDECLCAKDQGISGLTVGPSLSSSSGGSSSTSGARSSPRSFKKVTVRAFCSNEDGTSAVSSCSESGLSLTLQEGSETTAASNDCPDGQFVSGIKQSSGGSSSLTAVCSSSSEYQLDSLIDPLVFGPIKAGKLEIDQAQNPSKSSDGRRCQTDLAVAIGIDDEGITLKVASFKGHGKQFDSC